MISEFLTNIMGRCHYKYVAQRRVKSLAGLLGDLIPANTIMNGLDIGCGNTELAQEVTSHYPDISFVGIDVLPSPDLLRNPRVDFNIYDGKTIPYADKSFSFSMLVDVLHHTDNAALLLTEAIRVSRDFILIKDHICESELDKLTLTFMDWVGNKSHNVALPYNYLSNAGWNTLFESLGLVVEKKLTYLPLFPYPFSLAFGRGLHFIVKLKTNLTTKISD